MRELRNDPNQIEKNDLRAAEQFRLKQAQSTFRRLGSEMKALADNEDWSVRILQRRGYDPAKASAGLIGYSNSIDTQGTSRHHFDQMIRTALRLPAA